MFGKDVTLVLQVQQRPIVVVATQDDAAAFTTVTPVGAAVRVILHMAQVHGALAAFAAATVYLDVVYEVAFH
jgi:hypothetical protein